MKFQNELNKLLWDKNELRPEVVSRLHGVAQAFVHFAEIPQEALKDIRIVGSSASYNYVITKKYKSDLDLHLVVDYKKVSKDSKLLSNYLWAVKQLFNSDFHIHIREIPVEVYVEPVGEEAVSNGIYSLNKGWLRKPEHIPPTDNDGAVRAKYNELREAIERVEDKEEAERLIKKIYNMRKAGLADTGEYSVENLAFKRLRREGLVDKLRNISHVDLERELSLESLQEGVKDMADINDIIVKLTALKLAAKNIHYKCTSYAIHLLADKLAEAADVLDDMKEQAFLSHREFPLTEEEYAERASKEVPNMTPDNDRQTLISFAGFIDTLRKDLNAYKPNERAINVLCDEADSKLATAAALLYIQTRVTPGLNEAQEDMKLEVKCDHEGCKQVPVDRKEYKQEVPSKEEQDKIAKKVVKQSEEELAATAVGESVLDRLAEKLGV